MRKYMFISLLFFLTSIFSFGNTLFLPHLVVGGGYSSSVTITNLIPDQKQYVYIVLYDNNGNYWTIPSNYGTSMRFNFSISPLASIKLKLSLQSSNISSGWGMVVSNGPVMISTNYSKSENDKTIAMAGILPSSADVFSVFPVSIDVDNGINTGVAIVNPNSAAAEITIELIDSQGNLVETKTIQVKSMSKFVSYIKSTSMFDNIIKLDGFIKLSSNSSIAVTGLFTKGANFSTLSVVHRNIPWRNAHTIFVSPIVGSDTFGDGSLSKPYKTIKKALLSADRGWTIYLLPGTYSKNTGEEFPIQLGYCMIIRGESANSVFLIGGNKVDTIDKNCTILGGYKGMITNVTIMNFEGTGIYTTTTLTIGGCRIINCLNTGIDIANGWSILFDNIISDNEIGVHIYDKATPDLGGGLNFCKGGNFFVGNRSCDIYYEGTKLIGIRFNSWDSAIPERSTTCSDGVDIAAPSSAVLNY